MVYWVLGMNRNKGMTLIITVYQLKVFHKLFKGLYCMSQYVVQSVVQQEVYPNVYLLLKTAIPISSARAIFFMYEEN